VECTLIVLSVAPTKKMSSSDMARQLYIYAKILEYDNEKAQKQINPRKLALLIFSGKSSC